MSVLTEKIEKIITQIEKVRAEAYREDVDLYARYWLNKSIDSLRTASGHIESAQEIVSVRQLIKVEEETSQHGSS